MPNIANILKSEISRVARREIRAEILALKKAAGAHRSEIAGLKRRTHALEQQVGRMVKVTAKAVPAVDRDEPSTNRRYSAKGLASQRKRLGLSASDCGLLVGASAPSIYNWENGKVRPQAHHLDAIAALKALGRRAAAERLQGLRGAA